MKRTER